MKEEIKNILDGLSPIVLKDSVDTRKKIISDCEKYDKMKDSDKTKSTLLNSITTRVEFLTDLSDKMKKI